MRGVLARHVIPVDCVLAAVIAVFTVTAPHPDALPGAVLPLSAKVAGALAALALAGRRWRPRTSFALVVVCTAGAFSLAGSVPIYIIAVPVGLYTVAVRTDRRTTVFALVLSTFALVVAVAVVSVDLRFFVDGATGLLGWSAVVATVGDAVRSRRVYLAATEERAVRAERTREEEARRQVVEERLRIARELHDVVAHHVAVVSVQAGLAGHLILKQPQAAQQALRQVQRASAAILDDLAGILGVLRQPGEQDQVAPPAPGLWQLDELVDSYVAAGLLVQLSTAGQPRELNDSAGLVAYRVVQEALTNAHKHGGPSVRVVVTYTRGDVVLDVVNLRRHPRPEQPGTGLGLTGMRERAVAVGGTLEVRDAADEFRVRLTLPAPVGAP